MEWRPIESAPKDGTPILTYCPQGPKYGKWAVRQNVWRDGAWQYSNQPYWPPTHWMPLPEPPAIVKAKIGEVG